MRTQSVNVAIVHRSLQAYRELGPEDVEELVARFWDPDADYYPARKFPEARPCHGREEIARFHAEYLSRWDRYDSTIKAVIAVGDVRVLAYTTVRAEDRESGLKFEGELFHCDWLRHGRIFRAEDHLTLPGALRALGLSGHILEAAGLRE